MVISNSGETEIVMIDIFYVKLMKIFLLQLSMKKTLKNTAKYF